MVAVSVFHSKTVTAPDDPTYAIVPTDWNTLHRASAMLQGADFANSNNVTFGVDTNGVVTASAAGGGGGATSIFANSNGVSWGTAGSTVTATVRTDYQSSGAYLTTAALSQDSSKYAGTNGAMTGGSITLNTSGVSINLPAYLTTAQPPGAYLTTAALSQDSSKYAGTGTSATNVSVTLNTNGIAISIAAPAAGTSLSFANSNGVTFGTAGSTLTATVKTDYQTSGAYLTTAALSQDSSKYAGINGAITGGSITVNTSGVSVNLPAYLTTAALSADSSKYAGTSTGMTGGSVTLNTSGIAINLPAYLTTAALSGDSSKYAGTGFTTTTTNATAIAGTLNTSGLSIAVPSWILNVNITAGTTHQAINNWSFADANGVSWVLNVKTISASVNTSYRASNDGLGLNTAGTNITWTANSAGVSINAAGYAGTGFSGTGATATLNSNGLQISVGTAAPSPINFSAGSTSGNLGSVVFADSNGVTWGLNGSTITATVQTNYLTTAALSQDSSKYAGTGTSATNASITLNTAGLAISVGAPGGGATISSYENMPFLGASGGAAIAAIQSTSIGVAFFLPQAGSFSFMRTPVSLSIVNSTTQASTAASANASWQGTTTFNMVVYSMGTGASSRSAMSVTSASGTWGATGSLSVLANGTQYTVSQIFNAGIEGNTTQLTSSLAASQTFYQLAGTAQVSDFSGPRLMDWTFANSLAPQAYWMIFGQSTSAANNSTVFSALLSRGVPRVTGFLLLTGPAQSFGIAGSSNLSIGFFGAGSFSTAGGGTTANFPISAISTFASAQKPYFQLLRSA